MLLKRSERPVMGIQPIVVAGDSHTWGQGSGGERAMGLPLAAGELRPMGFGFPSYVNLLRERLERSTGSKATEFDGKALASLAGISLQGESALLQKPGDCLRLPKAELYRVVFQGREESSLAEVRLDGRPYAAVPLTMPKSDYMYRLCPVLCEPGGGEAELCCLKGSVLIYRVEAYTGPFAVINSGLGSCPLSRYLLPEVWDSWVKAWHPAAVIAEGNTINDWLAQETPEEYERLLVQEINMIRMMGAQPFLHTVAPILGSQDMPYSPVRYPRLVETVRQVARQEQVPFADANQEMKQKLAVLSEQEGAALLFSDPWHPNAQGHCIYAQSLFELISPFLFELV